MLDPENDEVGAHIVSNITETARLPRAILAGLVVAASIATPVSAATIHVDINTEAWQGKRGYLVFEYVTPNTRVEIDPPQGETPEQSDVIAIHNFTHNGVMGLQGTLGGRIVGELMWQENPAPLTVIDADRFVDQDGFIVFDRRFHYNRLALNFSGLRNDCSPASRLGTSITFDIVLPNDSKTHVDLGDQLAVYLLDAAGGFSFATGDLLGTNALFALDSPFWDGQGVPPTEWEVSVFSPAAYTPGDPALIEIVLPPPAPLPGYDLPGPVTDLQVVDAGKYCLSLQWTASGADGSVGQAVEYDLRYWSIPITEDNFCLATKVSTGVPVPGPPGTPQNVIVNPLASGVTYYFAIRTKDAEGNWSLLSNVAVGHV